MQGRRHSLTSSLPLQIFSQSDLLCPCPASYSVLGGGEMLKCQGLHWWCFSAHATSSWLGPARIPSLVLGIYVLPFSHISHSCSPPPRTAIVMGLPYVFLLNALLWSAYIFLNLCQWYWVVMSVLLAREPPPQDPSSPSQRMSLSRRDLLILHFPQGEGAPSIHSFNRKKGNNIAQWLRTQALRSNAL